MAGYLICDRCDGYYELRDGERPEDFDRCQCGGKLEYAEEFTKKPSARRVIGAINARRIGGVLIGAAVMAASFYISSPDPYQSSFAYYHSISFYLWGAGGLVAALVAGGNIRSAVANGFYAAAISGALVILLYYYIAHSSYFGLSSADNLALLGALGLVYILVPGVFAMVGGLITGVGRMILLKITK